ncbi:hypothetical protein [uncultured Enterococcus sp.]|uniref:hypothetical protein n=1 Tax=uncultured Enterococcus sp. TaxID=167972 RepID=UPI002AA6B6CA|nr:hypothetical protein [uncultured Enterococcus sp.]
MTAEEAAKKARRAAKERRRRELNRQATEVRAKINKAVNLISSFQSKQTELTSEVTQITSTKTSALSSQITKEVRVSKVFEGVIAEKQAASLPTGVELLETNIQKAEQVVEGIADQIQKLSEYQQTQETKLSSIMSQLASL